VKERQSILILFREPPAIAMAVNPDLYATGRRDVKHYQVLAVAP
jgi:hypothetical protein